MFATSLHLSSKMAHRDGHTLFQLVAVIFLGVETASENMKCGEYTPYSFGQVHDFLVFFATSS